MWKEKGKEKIAIADKDDSANAPIAVNRVKKSLTQDGFPEKTWEDLGDDNFEIIEEVDSDDQKNIVYKKRKGCKDRCDVDDEPVNTDDQGIVYPEIVWYFISLHIEPEDVGRFAGINKVTYSITKQESFWRSLYRDYCQDRNDLPKKLRIENNNKIYNLRETVIRGLHHTYDVFLSKVERQFVRECDPYLLINRKCINVWLLRGHNRWFVYFKLKESHFERKKDEVDFVEELDRIDANSEEFCQMLQVSCRHMPKVVPVAGMTLSSVSVSICGGLHYKLHLGFKSGSYTRPWNKNAERCIVIDTMISMYVFDWWVPMYPRLRHDDATLTPDEESSSFLKDLSGVCNYL